MQIVPGRFFIKLLLTRKHLNVFFQWAYRWHHAQVRSQWGEMDHNQHADSPRLRAQFNSQLPRSPQSIKRREAGCAFPLWGPPWDRYCSALSSSYLILAVMQIRVQSWTLCSTAPCVKSIFTWEGYLGQMRNSKLRFYDFLVDVCFFFFFFSAS